MKNLYLLSCIILTFGWLNAQPTPVTGEIQTEVSALNTPWASFTDHSELDLSPDGSRYVISWENPLPVPINNSKRVFARVFNSDGTPATAEIMVTPNQNAFLGGGCAINNTGTFVITHEGEVGTGGEDSLYIRVFSTNGTQIGGPTLVTAANQEYYESMAIDPQGNSFIFYSQEASSGFDIYIKKFNSAGNLVAGPVFVENTNVSFFSSNLEFRNDGNLVATFNGDGVKYIAFNPNLGIVVPLTTLASSGAFHFRPGLHIKPNNDVVITYRRIISQSPLTDQSYIQKFDDQGTPLGPPAAIGAQNKTVWLTGNERGSYFTLESMMIQEYDVNDNLIGSPVQANTSIGPIGKDFDAGGCTLAVGWSKDVSLPLTYLNRVFSFTGPPPVSDFTLPTEVCIGEPIWFDGNPSEDEEEYRIEIFETSGFGTTNVLNTLYQASYQGQVGTIDLTTLPLAGSFQAGNYYLVNLLVKHECSEWVKSSHWIFINPLPIANAGPDKTICDRSTQIGPPRPISQPVTYSWSPVTALSNPNIVNPHAAPSVTTTYTLTVTNTNTGCVNTDQVTVYVDAGTAPTINLNSPGACLGSQVCFSATPTSSPSATYSWTVDNGSQGPIILTGPNPCYTYNTTGPRTIILEVVNSCGTFTAEKEIIVGEDPNLQITYHDPVSPCSDPSLEVTGVGGTSPYTYTWCCGLGTNPIVNVSATSPAIYAVQVTDANGCTNSGSYYVGVSPYYSPLTFDTPVQNVFTPNNDNIIDEWCLYDGNATSHAYNATNYKIDVYDRWGTTLYYTNSVSIPSSSGFSSPSICWDGRNQAGQLMANDAYYIVYTLQNCGYTYTGQQTVNLMNGSNKVGSVTVTEEDIQPISEMEIYPNPVSDVLKIALSKSFLQLERVRIYNSLGKVVWDEEVGAPRKAEDMTLQVPTDQLPSGTYFIEVVGENTWRKSFVKH